MGAPPSDVQAAEGLLVPALAHVGTREAGQIARRRLGPAPAVRVAAVQVDDEPRQRAHVLVVVPNDVRERPGLAEAQVVEVARRDLPARDVRVASDAEQLRLDGGEARIGHPVPEDAAHDRQQVQVARVERRFEPAIR